jgi:glycosyltransferase involved in cell wall biosynthesis
VLTAVIPVFNEVESLFELHSQLRSVCSANGYEMEIIFVDDGSTDGSWDAITKVSEADPLTRGLRFRRNFGKADALNAGFAEARGELVFTLDADLQDDPVEIPRFVAEIEKGFDVVSGWKQVRNDPWHKVGPSRVFNWMISTITGVKLHDHNCGFKCYKREIFDEVNLYGELHRFVPVLAHARGWKVSEIAVHHRARQHGGSKYGFERFTKGFLDLLTVRFLTGFGQRPQHLLGTIGLLAFAIGGIGLAALTLLWGVSRAGVFEMDPVHLHERAVFYYSIVSILLGAQLTSIGFLAEMIASNSAREHSLFSVSERTDE